MEYFQYYVEGEDEEKLINVLKSDMQCIVAGKVQVLNPVTEKISVMRLRTLKKYTTVILVFDTDVSETKILEENIKILNRCANVKNVYCIPQVFKIEDELERCCNINSIDGLLGTSGGKEFKHRLIVEKNLKKKLEMAGFDIKKLWGKAPTGLFKDVPNDSDKIKL